MENFEHAGLGRNPNTGCIVASDEWWAEQNAAMSGCITFRDNLLEHEDQQRIMFDAISVTNETSYVPVGGSDALQIGQSEDAVDAISEDGGTPKVTPTSDKRVQKRPAPISPPEKKKKTFRDQCMKRLVDAYEKKAQSSKQDEVTKMIDQVIEDGAEEGSDEHYYATQLLMKKEYRDMFSTLKTPSGRLGWLRRAWEDKNKN
ncbi:unnamed protein product [Miscanthus lutarioriparius]|uniref:Uncharacterized protein n=1 Tax=Miscanthus lutarioriparius TaxID=422564 RepID=A0A811NJZ4_9POAL|nr:unnamed protein product [Miscanthus lutarioriparius]